MLNKIQYGIPILDKVLEHPDHFTEGKRYKVIDDSFYTDLGISLSPSWGLWLIEVDNKNVIGARLIAGLNKDDKLGESKC